MKREFKKFQAAAAIVNVPLSVDYAWRVSISRCGCSMVGEDTSTSYICWVGDSISFWHCSYFAMLIVDSQNSYVK